MIHRFGLRNNRRFYFLGLLAVGLLLVGDGTLLLLAIPVSGLIYLVLRAKDDRRFILFGLAVTSVSLVVADVRPQFAVLLLLLVYLVLRFAPKPLSGIIARLSFSIRWKFEAAIAVIAAMFLIGSLVTTTEMDFMHDELHKIQDAGMLQPSEVLFAVNDLEDKQHGILFKVTPILGMLGLVLAAVLGAAMAWSVIIPVRSIGEAMGRIGSGEFSRPVHVGNRDELGELARQINDTSEELARLQEVTLVAERARAQQERLAQVTVAEEEERRRISRELHDGLGPSLAAIGNQIRISQSLVRTAPERAESELEEVTRSLKKHVQEIRELIHGIRPLDLDQLGFAGALSQNVKTFGEDCGIEVSINVPSAVTFNPFAEVTVLRVVQECLSNVQKHAAASHVDLSLEMMETGVEVRVRDNGQGFDPSHVSSGATSESMGLVSMKERADLLGGSLSVQSSPGKGCQIVLYVPSDEVRDATD